MPPKKQEPATPAPDVETKDEALAVLFPGKDVPLDMGDDRPAGKAVVMPLGFRHLRKFTDQITRALGVVGTMNLPSSDDPTKLGKAIMMTAAPLLMGDLFELLKECVTIESPAGLELEDLPHWLIPGIVSAWIEISFGDPKKWRPWITAIDSTMGALTRQPFSILETVRSAASAPDTPGTK